MAKIYFEQRKYSREEIAEILHLDAKNKNFARQVKTKLINLGFEEGEDFYYSRKEVTILWIPQTREERIRYLVALLGIDKQVDAHAFAVFTYRMLWDEDYQRMPWKARAKLFREQDDLIYDERTYRNWTNKLIDLDILRKDKENTAIWCSFTVDGKKYQDEVSEDDVDWIRYKNRRNELLELGANWNTLFKQLWEEFHCVYYKCGSFVGKAWVDNEIIHELLSLIAGYFED